MIQDTPWLIAKLPEGLKLEWVEWGTANNFGETIELHKDLLEREDLLWPILEHELKHFDSKNKAQDVVLDMVGSEVYRYELLKFMLKRPKTWIQLLPFYYSPRRKQIIYDFSVLVFWMVTIALSSLIGGLLIWLL